MRFYVVLSVFLASGFFMGCNTVNPVAPSAVPTVATPAPQQLSECAHIDTSTYAGWLAHERCINGR